MDITQLNDKELIVRKRIASFLEKLLQYLGYDFRHDTFKGIVYGETDSRTPQENRIKNYFDAYVYLLSNRKTAFTKDMLRRFFYIMSGKVADECLLLRTVSKFYHLADLPPLEKAIEFHVFAYENTAELGRELQLVCSLMLFNYTLVSRDVPTVQWFNSELEEYERCRDKFLQGDKSPLYGFMFNIIGKSKFQDKSYYQNLVKLTLKDVYTRILQDKDMLIEKYNVENISIFGSFAKGIQRMDSDIDMTVTLSDHLTFDEKDAIVKEIAKHYFGVFNRHIDITEIGKYVCDEFVRGAIKIKKVF